MFFGKTVVAEDLTRLQREREEADRAYNDALTAVDRALPQLPEMPHAPPGPDEHQVTPLNNLWNILPDDVSAFARGWGGRFRMLAWRMIEPIVRKQQAFNSALVDHVNRNVTTHRGAAAASASTIAVLRDQLAALEALHFHLIQLLQRVTLYVDTKDREYVGLLMHRTDALAAGLAGVGDELQKRWESMVARERRYEATAVRAVGDLQSSVAVLQRSVQSVKRELERVLAGVPAPVAAAAAGATRAPVASGRRPGAPPAPPSQIHGGLDSCKYVGFEDQFRGSEGEIRARLSEYAGLFDGARDVLDVGCGRGEFLEILRERGVNARGLDINHEMVEVCRGRGLDVAEGDALDYLASLADESLGGLLAAQVVEHLAPEYLVRLLEVASHKLRPGAAIVLETINPACWAAFFESYIRDITHVRPLHPETLKYLLVASGFHQVEVRYRAPYPDHAKLQPVPIPSAGPPGRSESALAELAATFNANVEKINGLLFTYFDYAAIGRRA